MSEQMLDKLFDTVHGSNIDEVWSALLPSPVCAEAHG